MKHSFAKRQKGMALLALLAVIMLGASWFLLSQLNAESGGRSAVTRNRNAEVLNRAKLALIGYVAAQAAKAGEDNPGALPCPEAAGYYGDPAQEGQVASSCSLPKVGRFPWRTIGTEKLVDASGEPLWYVVSAGWARTGGNTNINSNTLGQLTVDGVANDAVALIIAPGLAFSVPAAAGCAAKNQVRPTSGTLDWQNYLECENATSPPDSTFVTSGPSSSFNDQVIRVTVADIMPAIEAAIANRIEREIAPVLKAYANPTWGTFPFPAPFGDPATSDYRGQAGPPYQGLLPFNYHDASGCGGNVRCSTDTTITWNSAPSVNSSGPGPGFLTTPTSSPASPLPNCYVIASTPTCEGYYYYGGGLNISMSDAVTTQIANGLRTFTLADHTGTFQALRWTGSAWVDLGTQSATVSRSLASDGTARFVADGPLPSVPGWGYFYIRGSRPTISDHSILSAADPTTGWFVRNEWYRLLYYAIAQGYAPGGSLSCISGGSGSTGCLQVTNLADPTKQRAVLALAGRPLPALSQIRPAATLQNYLDGAENRNLDSIFVQSPVNGSFNDRFISIGKNP